MRHLVTRLCSVSTILFALGGFAACSAEATQVVDEGVASSDSDKLENNQKMMADGAGNLYVINPNGDLLWYRDSARNGTSGWERGSGNRIGKGWGAFVDVAADANGVFYALKSNGELVWYKNEATDGNVAWTANSGTVIRVGLTNVVKIWNGGRGVLYMLTNTGDLRFYQDTSRSGTNNWTTTSGTRIGQGWNVFTKMTTCNDNTFYTVDAAGDLRWWRDIDGNGNWDLNSGKKVIGWGWGAFKTVACGANGMLYGVDGSANLRWYLDINRKGNFDWASVSSSIIGVGFWNIASPTGTLRACGANTDCPAHQECRSGACRVMGMDSWCESDVVATNTRGDRVTCGGYKCSTGVCPTSCSDSSACSDGYSCNTAKGRCVLRSDYRVYAPGPGALSSKVPYRETINVLGCSSDANCATGESCVRGVCYRAERRCNDALDASIGASYSGSTTTSCGRFRCEPISGTCNTFCLDALACSSTNVCDSSALPNAGLCVAR